MFILDMPEKIPCIICNNPAKLTLENFNGYIKEENFNVYYCPFCNTSFVWPHKVDNKIYDYIYSQADVTPGYNRYALYAEEIKTKKNALSYLSRKEAMYFAVKKILKLNSDKTQKILEVGSGLGYLTYAISQEGYDIKGLDISRDAVKKAELKFGSNYICQDVYQYALDNQEKFDLVILTEVVEHVPSPNEFFNILIKLIKPGGRLVISTPNKSAYPQNEFWNTELPPVHLTWFSEDSFKVISQQTGLAVTFFDFTDFNKRHFDFTKYKFYENYNRRHKRVPTLNSEGKVLEPFSLIVHNSFLRLATNMRSVYKKIIERLVVMSPLISKKDLHRNSILCTILQKPK
ncbi:MAG: class I SAM-dependent methyltransferase [Ginsengibacter sp.]